MGERPSLGDGVPATVVEYDNEGGAFAMTSHLLSVGHRRIAFLGASDDFTTAAERVAGYRRAHDAFGVPVDTDLVVRGDFTRSFGYSTVARLLADGPEFTAIFAGTDMVAAGAIQAVREAGLRIPYDISVAGYDDVPLASEITPRLTTVHVPHQELGRTAVRQALHRHEEGVSQHVVLGTHIVVRDSVRPPRGTPR